MEVPEEVVNNWIMDLKKKDINPFQRAKLIKNYINEKDLSGRGFSKEFNIPKSTVEDWLLWLKIEESAYNNLIKLGYTHTDIYRTLRDNKNKKVKELFKSCETELDLILWKFNRKLTPFLKNFPEETTKTKDNLREIKTLIEVLGKHYGV